MTWLAMWVICSICFGLGWIAHTLLDRSQRCCVCGRSVDTSEDDTPGCELSDGRWVCSRECWDKATSE